jgi:hypothetical protein
MPRRVSSVNFFVLMTVVAYTIFAQKYLLNNPLVHPIVDSIIVLLTSMGVYRIIAFSLIQVLGGTRFFLRLYWGRLYLDGFWSYSYTLDGKDADDTVYFGVWRIEQDLFETKVLGFGLTDKFIVRSRVRSMTDMISTGGLYEFINIRSDAVDPANDFYSRTSMHFELNKNWFMRYPIRMRGKTVVYGGPYNGRVYNTVFVKHEKAWTEEDVIEALKRTHANLALPSEQPDPPSLAPTATAA